MSSLIMLLAATVMAGEEPAPIRSADPGAASPRLLTEIGQEIREVLRAEAHAATPQQQSAAVHRMAEIYREILADQRLGRSETLQTYKARLWSRMTRIQQDLQRQVRRAAEAGQNGEDAERQAAIQQATADLAEQMEVMSYTLGGPAYVFQQSGGAWGGGAVNDHGQELIELIQRTIKPDFWDTAGGPGSMFYYQPLMALVVTATAEVHGNVGGLLGALRRAGQ